MTKCLFLEPLFKNLLILETEGRREGGKERHHFVFPLIYAFIEDMFVFKALNFLLKIALKM